MASFGQFKNNCQVLKKYLIKMNSINQCDIKPQLIDQNFLKQNNPHIFLQILHYILIKFSPFLLFVKVLDYYPTIKDDSDKKFTSNIMTLARKMFEIDVKIDLDQFLSTKFVQKKTQFISIICKAAYEYHLKNDKSQMNNIKPNKKLSDLTNYIPSKVDNKNDVDDDSQDQMPKRLNMAPSTTKRPVVMRKDKDNSQSDQDLRELLNKKKQLNKMKQKGVTIKKETKRQNLTNISKQEPRQLKKGNMFPKNMRDDSDQQNEFIEQNIKHNRLGQVSQKLSKFEFQDSNLSQKYQERSQQRDHRYQQRGKILRKQKDARVQIQKPIMSQKLLPQQQQQFAVQNQNQNQNQTQNYITRQQFMQIMNGMSKNFTQLLTKFNEFQSQVGGWVQNVNAKISILEENVKTIKNNL